MNGNRHNVIRALGDFLTGVSRYDSRDDVDSAPSKMRRATEAKRELGTFKPTRKPMPVKDAGTAPLPRVKKAP